MGKEISFFFTFFSLIFFQGQDFYSLMRKKYWEYEENDSRAFTYIDLTIATAKREKDYAELFQVYEDAIRFSANQKLNYADSAISVAKLSKNTDFIGNAYIGKGIVYYFNYRKFKLALDEYLKAYEYTKDAKDPFLKYQNLYHIGVVKSYLGYYEESLSIFKECIFYFEPNTIADIHPNLIKNNRKGYLNTLHQMIVCYQALGKHKEANQLINLGFVKTPSDPFFYLEKSYFKKSEGISDYQQKKYNEAIQNLNFSLVGLKKKNDFTWISTAYFYKGQSYQRLGKLNLAVENYKKIDSIFNKYHFLLPELRRNYEILVNYYRENNDSKQELYYTKQLLKADELISNDFKYLSGRIHKEYDTRALLDAKADLENANHFGKNLLIGNGFLILALMSIIFYWSRRRKQIQVKYDELLEKINVIPSEEKEKKIETESKKNSKLDSTLIDSLDIFLATFEQNKDFLKKGITLGKLASEFRTNTSYLSQYINEFKNSNFNTYLNQLRVEYATKMIYEDKTWRKYSIEDIAGACGFSSRQSFSNVFYDLNGIRPQDFVKKRKEEMELRRVS